jgi:hypothetical protein
MKCRVSPTVLDIQVNAPSTQHTNNPGVTAFGGQMGDGVAECINFKDGPCSILVHCFQQPGVTGAEGFLQYTRQSARQARWCGADNF